LRLRDDERFAVEVARLLDDPHLRLRLGAKARARVMEDFRLDHTIGKYLDLYRSFAA
jgi:glycosyltransferase involved in cell wall biosynthesis